MRTVITVCIIALQLLSVPARSVEVDEELDDVNAAIATFQSATNEESESAGGTIPTEPLADVDAFVGSLRNSITTTIFNETSALDIALSTSNDQRQVAVKTYFDQYEDNFVTAIIAKATNLNTKKLFQGLYYSKPKFISSELNDGFVKNVNRMETATEILCDPKLDAKGINAIKDAYNKYFGRSLVSDINTDVYTKPFFLAILNNTRSGNAVGETRADSADDKTIASATSLAAAFSPAGAKTRIETITNMFTSESFDQLRAIFAQYRKLTGLTITQSIIKVLVGDFKTVALSIVDASKSQEEYYSEKLKTGSVNSFTRILINTGEVNVKDIIQIYEDSTKVSLASVITTKATGTFAYGLLKLIGEAPPAKI